MNNEPKRRVRPIPCPVYDIETTESWLEDMARQGWLLEKEGFFAGFAWFEAAEPQEVRYRLEPTDKKMAPMDDDAQELFESLGWTLIAQRGNLRLFRSTDPDARELSTDPQVQAILISRLRRAEISNTLSTLAWVVIYPALYFRGGFIQSMVTLGTFLSLWALAMLVWYFISSFRSTLYYGRLKKRLSLGEAPQRGKDWRPAARRRYLGEGLCILLLAALIVCTVGRYRSYEASKIPLEDFSGDVPFATMGDVLEGEYSLSKSVYESTVNQYSDILAPEIVEWVEYANVIRDGITHDGIFRAKYYRTVSPGIAKVLAWELQQQKLLPWHRQDRDPIDLELEGADYWVAYFDEIHFPVLVFQKGDVAMEITFYQFGENTVSIQDWAQAVCDSVS